MNVPKNVLKNNMVRASIFHMEDIKSDQGYYVEKARDFIKQHQNTCAVYEVVMLTTYGSIGTGYRLLCPLCKKTEFIADPSNW